MVVDTLVVFVSLWTIFAVVLFSVIPFVFLETYRERRTYAEDGARLQRNTSEQKQQKQAMPCNNFPPSPETHELHAKLQQECIRKELIELRELMERERMPRIEREVRNTYEEPPRASFNADGDLYTDQDGVTWRMTREGRRVAV